MRYSLSPEIIYGCARSRACSFDSSQLLMMVHAGFQMMDVPALILKRYFYRIVLEVCNGSATVRLCWNMSGDSILDIWYLSGPVQYMTVDIDTDIPTS